MARKAKKEKRGIAVVWSLEDGVREIPESYIWKKGDTVGIVFPEKFKYQSSTCTSNFFSDIRDNNPQDGLNDKKGIDYDANIITLYLDELESGRSETVSFTFNSEDGTSYEAEFSYSIP